MSELKLMPQSLEAEEAVIGIIFNDKETIEEAKKYITIDMFYNESNKRLYQKNVWSFIEKKAKSIQSQY